MPGKNIDGGEWGGAEWIARKVPPSQRIQRHLGRSRVDWVEPGHSLAQSFSTDGPVVAINVDLFGPREGDPFTTDVRFSLTLQSASGAVLAEREFEGPQLVWDYFGNFLDVTPAAPPGDYIVVIRSDRGAIGWYAADSVDAEPDDGISPRPVVGTALADGRAVEGVRTLGVETVPAPNPLFRHQFDLELVPHAATLTATVLGAGVIRINGERVGDGVLEPAVTDWDKTVLFREWEVAHLLRPGTNEILIAAGRERYAARGGDTWGWHLAPWHREPVAIAQLALGDGRSLSTGAGWESAPGPVEAERLFRGEDWVLRDAEPVWAPAAVVAAPRGELRHAEQPPVRALAPRAPRLTTSLDERRTVFDFGEVIVGRVRCRVTGTPGSTVRVVSGELLDGDGAVVCDNPLVAGESQVDTLRLESAAAAYQWEPQFGYRGFRWMQLETTGEMTVDLVQAVPLYTQVQNVGSLTSGEPLLEWIDTATARTFLNNLHGIPTDTPIHEKNGWTADAHLATEGLLHHFDLRAAFGKWMDDHADAQSADGSIPQIVPTPGWGRATDPAWSSSAVLIPWYLYREYGDLAALERTEPMVRKFADHVVDRLDGGLWEHRTWGDWLPPGHLIAPEGMRPIGTIMSVTILQHTALILRALGDSASADRYAAEAARVGDRYHAEYFDPDRGHYAVPGTGYRQALNLLPLAFSTVREAHVDSVRQSLANDLEKRTGGHLDCGAVGVRHLLPVLSDAGRDDLALGVLLQRSRPSWGAWFEEGETTLLEAWDTNARSHNHYFLGSVAAWIQQRVGALRTVEPGWTRFEIAPVDDPRVRRGSARHVTPLGLAAVSWERGPGGRLFHVAVPEGSTALIRLPREQRTLRAGDHTVRIE